MVYKRLITTGCLVICMLTSIVRSEFYRERYYEERSKTTLDYDWKFYKGTPSGTPSDSAYNDASWQTVNVPHSASYDPPTPEGEKAYYKGVCWYRKVFYIPAAKHTGKIFIEFEGAMQSADVWLNGTKLGVHDNSGYTWFSFDITDKVSLTGLNILAVRLDNNFSLTIPPGLGGPINGLYPDYYLYSGLYRDVWLVCVNECYIPLYGQQISVPKGTASTSSAQVRVKTTVRNEYGEPKQVKVAYTITDSSDQAVVSDEMTASVEAGQSYIFDKTMGPISSPTLWSPETPYLYKVFTQVFIDDQIVDDYVDRFGVRWYDWTPDDGFSLNGTPTFLKGVNLHQSIGWIESALSNRRIFKEVELCKDIGANLIRAAHFPRDPAFYDACDEIGQLSMIEVPTWGTTTTAYPDSFWIRQNEVVREMIEVGYNHPSIIAWGLFNEPMADYTGAIQVPLLNQTAHTLDSTRMTFMAHNRKNVNFVFEADIVGLNYGLDLDAPISNERARTINTEYHEGWVYECPRGGANDHENAGGYARQRWDDKWMPIVNYTGTNKLAGGCMWSFNDYWSQFQDYPMGVVDHYRIPKAVFYYFRERWTGAAPDYPAKDLTPAALELTSDMTELIADSTDVAIITAAIRDANGTCVHTGYPSGTPVTFAVSGPADYFGGLTVNSIAGKCALIIKSKNTPGTITVTATSAGLPDASVTISSIEGYIPTPITANYTIPRVKHVTIHRIHNAVNIVLPTTDVSVSDIALFNIRGQEIRAPIEQNGTFVTLNIRTIATGTYYIVIGRKADKTRLIRKIVVTR